MNFTCPYCECHLADLDVAIDKLDGKPLPRRFQRCYCKSCGRTSVTDGTLTIKELEFKWENLK